MMRAAAWLLGLLVGIQLLSEGAALSWMAWRIRHAPVAPASEQGEA